MRDRSAAEEAGAPAVTPAGPGWAAPVAAILCLQTTAAYLTRVIPITAPELTAEFGWSDEMIGYVASANVVGSIAFLLAGGPLIRRFGSVRVLQGGILLAVFGLFALAMPLQILTFLASLLFGLGYGPSAPAGNDVLQRYAPERHRSLIFSVKQAGVPLGGVVAGLTLPSLILAFGWRLSLVFSLIVILATVAAVQPLRASIDAGRCPSHPVGLRHLLSLENLRRPLATLLQSPALLRFAVVGSILAIGQGIWLAFLVMYFVGRLGFSLSDAGALFALMQLTGVFGRVLLGFVADRMGSGRRVLAIVAVASSLSSVAMIFVGPAWPMWSLALLVGIAGVTVSSWNGIHLAEIARLAPPGRVSEASAGAVMVVFAGYFAGPALFAAVLGSTQRFDMGFAGLALLTLAALVPLASRGLRGSA